MRVLYFNHYFRTPAMAGGTRCYELARRWVREGHEVDVITGALPRDPDFRATSTEIDGINVHWLDTSYSHFMSYRARMRAFGEYAIAAERYARRLRSSPDVIVATSTPLTIAIPSVRTARRLGVPMVFEVRDLWPEVAIAMGALKSPVARHAARRLERYAYFNAAHVAALSPDMKDGVMATGYPGEQVSVIPNSCDFDLFDVGEEAGDCVRRDHDWLGSRPLALFVGTLGAANDVGWLIDLAAAVHHHDPEVRFWLAGSGNERGLVRARAAKHGLLNRSVFIGESVAKRDVPAMLSAANLSFAVFADLPSLWTGSPNKVFDSLAAATPVAVNYGGWQADVLETSGAGLVLPRADIDAAAETVTTFLASAERQEDASEAAAKLGVASFSREDHAQQYLDILDRVTR